MNGVELVLEYYDKNKNHKVVLVNEFCDTTWIVNIELGTENTCVRLNENNSLRTILEDIDYEMDFEIEGWFCDCLVKFCENEIAESGTDDMKQILEELASC